jgi:hypothetical protein
MSQTIPPSRRCGARAGVWLALLALWIQALLPVVHQPTGAMSGAFGPGMSGSLCLAPGGAPAAPLDKAPHHKIPPCPICQTFQILAAGFVPPSATAIPLPGFAGLVAAAISTDTALPGPLHFRPQARAPPLST